MHIAALILAVGKEDTKDNRINLQSQMNSHAKKGNVFTRPAPGTYGLIEFEATKAEDLIG